MSKEIKCSICKAYLGEIREARLRKDTMYICKKCYNKIEMMDLDDEEDETPQYKSPIPDSKDFMTYFGNILRGVK